MGKTLLTVGVFAVLAFLFALATNDGRLPWRKPPDRGPDWCAAHEKPLSADDICNPRLARGGTTVTRDREPVEGECPNTLVRIMLAEGVAKSVDLRMEKAQLVGIEETIRANAETQYVPSRFGRVAPRGRGIIREVKAVLGQDVAAGATLAVIESTALGEAKVQYLQALSTVALRQSTYDKDKGLGGRIIPGREVRQAEIALEESKLALGSAEQKLRLYGLDEERIRQVAEQRTTSPLLEVTAPFEGTIVAAAAVPGESADPEKPMFSVASLDRLWLAVDVSEADFPKVEIGQRVSFSIDSLPGRKFPGRVAAVSGEVDGRTRTVRVFAEIKNPQRMLRANMFGRAEITVKPAERKLLIPKDALQNDGDCAIVFVSPSKDAFQARKVDVGAAYESGFEIVGGLAEGEAVVTTGSFLLKTEVLRGQIGAG